MGGFYMVEDWQHFLLPYQQAVNELKVKLRGIRKQYQDETQHSPIEFVTGRVKPVDSIKEKMIRRHVQEDRLEQDMQDIAGLRIMCQFVEDIYQVVDLLRQRSDMTILEERDYISNAKPSGYRSYHIVIEYPVQLISGEKKILAEIQVRTLAMNFWATIEHSLNYKNYPRGYNELQKPHLNLIMKCQKFARKFKKHKRCSQIEHQAIRTSQTDKEIICESQFITMKQQSHNELVSYLKQK